MDTYSAVSQLLTNYCILVEKCAECPTHKKAIEYLLEKFMDVILEVREEIVQTFVYVKGRRFAPISRSGFNIMYQGVVIRFTGTGRGAKLLNSALDGKEQFKYWSRVEIKEQTKYRFVNDDNKSFEQTSCLLKFVADFTKEINCAIGRSLNAENL